MEVNMKKTKNTQLERGAGVLLPVSALPSNYGIGTLGEEAYKFVDLLEGAGQKYWQVLPVGPTSFGDSPYQSFSAFAGNPYFIDLDVLMEDKLLEIGEIKNSNWGEDEKDVSYGTIYKNRFEVLKLAFSRSKHTGTKKYIEFCKDNKYWLEDYAFYMALKGQFDNKEWSLWDDDIKFREEAAIIKYKEVLKEEIEFWKYCQFEFTKQWKKLKAYANKKKIRIIGDIPLYVAMDSSDVWVHGELFELDERKNPIHVAGVPPDMFSEDGQRWGNPLYDWKQMEEQDFNWWRERMRSNSALYDVIRIDHFIGIVRFYSIPSSCKTAIEGRWKKGPGKKLTNIISESIGDVQIIAEDLGVIVPQVRKLIKKTGYPGMKIIQFAFDGGADNEYLPHHYVSSNIVVYSGTHDNETIVGYLNGLKPEKIKYICEYMNLKNKKDLPDRILSVLYGTAADVVVYQIQDLLKLDNSARMNTPSTVGINWRWRITREQMGQLDSEKLKRMVSLYGR